MKPAPEEIAALARQTAEAEDKLQQLESEIEEIGQPAAHELQRRLDALKVEKHALQRNLAEVLGMEEPKEARMAKIEALLAWIQSEEAAVERDAEFLHQAAPTSSQLAAQVGTRLVELSRKALKRIIGDHHPLGASVFVNRSPETLEERYGVGADEKTRKGDPPEHPGSRSGGEPDI